MTSEPQKRLARCLKSRVRLQNRVQEGRVQFTLLRSGPSRMFGIAAVPALIFLAGCGGSSSGTGISSNGTFSISPTTLSIDTNCTGCNTTNNSGTAIEQFSATLSGGGAANVTWTVSGGDANTGAGNISTSGQYTPPPYLTADNVKVTVTATLASGTGAGTSSNSTVTVTPGFLEPLTQKTLLSASMEP